MSTYNHRTIAGQSVLDVIHADRDATGASKIGSGLVGGGEAVNQQPELFIAHHKSPINDYHYLAVRDGSRMPPAVFLIDGRMCYVSGTVRRQSGPRRFFYNVAIVRYLDDGSSELMPAGQFNKRAKSPPAELPV